jgi:hypothetical protein
MNLNDEKIIEFFAKSPIRVFPAMLDALRYLDGNWIWEELEYELFDEALGDNPQDKVSIRVPNIRGIPANVLLAFTSHAAAFHMIRRRSRKMPGPGNSPEEMIVFYELMPAGRYIVSVLEAIVTVTNAQA